MPTPCLRLWRYHFSRFLNLFLVLSKTQNPVNKKAERILLLLLLLFSLSKLFLINFAFPHTCVCECVSGIVLVVAVFMRLFVTFSEIELQNDPTERRGGRRRSGGTKSNKDKLLDKNNTLRGRQTKRESRGAFKGSKIAFGGYIVSGHPHTSAHKPSFSIHFYCLTYHESFYLIPIDSRGRKIKSTSLMTLWPCWVKHTISFRTFYFLFQPVH